MIVNDFEMNTEPNHAPILRVVTVVVFWVAVETERFANTSVITVPQWEDYIVLGTKIDEGEGTRPILLLLAVVTDRFVLNTASLSKDENAGTKELGRWRIFAVLHRNSARDLETSIFSWVLWDILAMSKCNVMHVPRRTSTMVPPNGGT